MRQRQQLSKLHYVYHNSEEYQADRASYHTKGTGMPTFTGAGKTHFTLTKVNKNMSHSTSPIQVIINEAQSNSKQKSIDRNKRITQTIGHILCLK